MRPLIFHCYVCLKESEDLSELLTFVSHCCSVKCVLSQIRRCIQCMPYFNGDSSPCGRKSCATLASCTALSSGKPMIENLQSNPSEQMPETFRGHPSLKNSQGLPPSPPLTITHTHSHSKFSGDTPDKQFPLLCFMK